MPDTPAELARVTVLEQPAGEIFARILWQTTMVAWNLCLGGRDYPFKQELRERMRNPEPGDMVVEVSGGMRQFDCSQAVGRLVKITREPIEMEWDEEKDGPIPDEQVVYITTIDGRDARWTNCSFYAVPQYDGWWDVERWKDKAAIVAAVTMREG